METDRQVRMITTSIEQTAQGLLADFNSDQIWIEANPTPILRPRYLLLRPSQSRAVTHLFHTSPQ